LNSFDYLEADVGETEEMKQGGRSPFHGSKRRVRN
jgi:hypothetical protein